MCIGIGYGGHQLSKSGMNLLEIAEHVGLTKALSAAAAAADSTSTSNDSLGGTRQSLPTLILMDVHTGLGPKGKANVLRFKLLRPIY